MGMQIKDATLEGLNQAARGDKLHLLSLMLFDRDVIDALKLAYVSLGVPSVGAEITPLPHAVKLVDNK